MVIVTPFLLTSLRNVTAAIANPTFSSVVSCCTGSLTSDLSPETICALMLPINPQFPYVSNVYKLWR